MVKEKLHYNDDDAEIGKQRHIFPYAYIMFRLGEEHNFPVLILTAIFYPEFLCFDVCTYVSVSALTFVCVVI